MEKSSNSSKIDTLADNPVDLGTDRLGTYGDIFYQKLMLAHTGLDTQQSSRLNARLVLLLANQIGDAKILEAVLARATGIVD